jgi:hypothetical protein
MTDRQILLKITNDKIWFNDTDSIEISFTDIPYEHILFHSHRDIYWKVQLIEFDKNTNRLYLNILNYSYNDLSTFLAQKPKKEIKYLKFDKFNWKYLEPLLSGYQKKKFIHQLINADYRGYESRKINESPNYKSAGFEGQNSIIRQPFVIKVEEEFAIDFKDSAFMLGYIKFSKYIKELNQTIDFKIINENILPEFDNIKYWFSKKLKTKKFNVKVIIIRTDNLITDSSATSKEIDSIDQHLIEGVKVQRTLGIIKSIRPQEIEKSLFTSDDLYSLDSKNDLEGNVFKQTEKDILDLLIEKSDVRNKKELSYLSGSKQSINYRIRFTNHPIFGFIFLAEGELNNHFIWELLNSNATYIWTIEKGIKEIETQYKRIESVINTILDCGREQYKRAYRTANQDNDLVFNVINHKDIGSQLIDEFPRWKHRINELIT